MAVDVHYVKDEDITVAFFPQSKRFFRVNDKAVQLIDSLIEGKSKDEIIQALNIDEKMYFEYHDRVFKALKGSNHIIEYNKNNRVLDRLVVHLTNDCNMRCKYCYANGGNYKSKKDMMSFETFEKVLSVFFKEFDIIRRIQFFAGEPLMNLPLLEYACERFSSIAKLRGYDVGFGVVTNGTLIEEKFISLAKKYNISVTLSYDGDYTVNNIMRVMQTGNGSSDIIISNGKRLKEETGQPETVEVTYNQHHLIQAVSIIDVVKHIQSIFPNTFVHLVPAGGSEQSGYAIKDLSVFANSIHEIFKQKKYDHNSNLPLYSLAQRIFYALENRDVNIPNICDAGIGTISVSTKGNVYPCFMFTDDENLCYGNIDNNDLFKSSKACAVSSTLKQFSTKDLNPECNNCFIKSLCNGCLGLNAFH